MFKFVLKRTVGVVKSRNRLFRYKDSFILSHVEKK